MSLSEYKLLWAVSYHFAKKLHKLKGKLKTHRERAHYSQVWNPQPCLLTAPQQLFCQPGTPFFDCAAN